jgi:hypothetical protein
MRGRQYYHSVPHIAPHSVQIGPSGDVWITLCLGRGLARFDPATGKFSLHDEPSEGLYPHTLRFDRQGHIWYTIAMSNHVARYDPASDTFTLYRLPTRTLGERFFVSTLRFWIWAADKFNVMDLSTSDPELLPIAYGIDIAPDGGIWFSQFNHRRIGRLDPVTGAIRMIDTPFYGPRRLRFDSKGILWIPAYAEGRIYRFDPRDDRSALRPPGRPGGMPCPRWTSGPTRSGSADRTHSIIRLSRRAGVHRLPLRVTFMREIDVDEGNVWTATRTCRLADRGRAADDHPASRPGAGGSPPHRSVSER